MSKKLSLLFARHIVDQSAREKRMLDLLERAAEVLNNYADVRDGDGGRPQPNAAMSMESEITEFLREVRQ